LRRATRSIARYPFLELCEHDVLDEGASETRVAVTVSLRDWAVVVAVSEAGELVLVEQYRHGVDAFTLEPAGGIIDHGEEPAQAALRELVEETGFGAEGAQPELLATVHPNPALSENRAFLFLVRGVRKVREPDDHLDERTRVVMLDAASALAATRDGRISHALGVLAIVLALSRA
jgi:8-oxo-dGTP pyrophosphatase MutT (NUDIX family)